MCILKNLFDTVTNEFSPLTKTSCEDHDKVPILKMHCKNRIMRFTMQKLALFIRGVTEENLLLLKDTFQN